MLDVYRGWAPGTKGGLSRAREEALVYGAVEVAGEVFHDEFLIFHTGRGHVPPFHPIIEVQGHPVLPQPHHGGSLEDEHLSILIDLHPKGIDE